MAGAVKCERGVMGRAICRQFIVSAETETILIGGIVEEGRGILRRGTRRQIGYVRQRTN